MTLIAEVFRKLRSPKKKVTWMSTKSRLKASFGNQQGKHAQILFKFAWQHLYQIYWLLWRQFICKKSLLVIWKISRLFPNSVSAYGKYSLLIRGNLSQRIYMQFSRKQKKFSQFFSEFLKSSWNFQHLMQKDDSHYWCISEIVDTEKPG